MRNEKELEAVIAKHKLKIAYHNKEVSSLREEIKSLRAQVRMREKNKKTAAILPADALAVATYANNRMGPLFTQTEIADDLTLQRDLFLVGKYLQGLSFTKAGALLKCSGATANDAFHWVVRRACRLLRHGHKLACSMPDLLVPAGGNILSIPLVDICREEFAKGNK